MPFWIVFVSVMDFEMSLSYRARLTATSRRGRITDPISLYLYGGPLNLLAAFCVLRSCWHCNCRSATSIYCVPKWISVSAALTQSMYSQVAVCCRRRQDGFPNLCHIVTIRSIIATCCRQRYVRLHAPRLTITIIMWSYWHNGRSVRTVSKKRCVVIGIASYVQALTEGRTDQFSYTF